MGQEQVFEQIARALGAQLAGSTELEGGSSANVWRLDLTSGTRAGFRSVVFRQHRPGELKDHRATVARKEYELLGRLHELGFPVAKTLLMGSDGQWFVTDFVEGTAHVDSADLVPALDQMVDLLVRLHSLNINTLDGIDLDPIADPVERLRNCLPSTPSGAQLRSILDGQAIGMHPNATVLTHGDFWPGNLLWADRQIAALIDWEDAVLGDPMADLACARVELLCQYDALAMDHFTNGYLGQSAHLDTRSLPIWECYVSGTALSSMHLWGLDAPEEARRRSLTQSFFDRAVAALNSD